MSTQPTLFPEVRALLDRERIIPSVPHTLRTRALARARASLALEAAAAPTSSRALPLFRWAVAAAVVLVAGAAVAATAYEIRARLVRAPDRRPPAHVVDVALKAPVSSLPTAAVEGPPPPATTTIAAAPRLSRAEAARAELRLLRQARAAVARRDFAIALSPLAEHTRRFRDGWLVEEREALRVKALAGLGRTEEARRAAAAFRTRFPRSVLSPAVSQM